VDNSQIKSAVTADHSTCANGGRRVRCDRCGDEYVCTPQRDFYCAAEGDHCCEVCLMASARKVAEAVSPPNADHPHTDPGDGRPECPTCGKFVWRVIHSCKGVPVTDAAMRRYLDRGTTRPNLSAGDA
jgi:hypothetical protein